MFRFNIALCVGASAAVLTVSPVTSPVYVTGLAERSPVIAAHPVPPLSNARISPAVLRFGAKIPTPPVTAEAQAGDILLNQHGFITNGPKLAVLRYDPPEAATWRLRDENNVVLLTGQTIDKGFDAASGHTVHHIDFSTFNVAGDGYRIQVGSIYSEPFTISDRPYEQLAKDSLSFYYLSRAAEPVIAAHAPAAMPPLTRAAGHINETVSCFVGEDTRGTTWPSCGYSKDVSGGWYDAGDYGKYTVSTGVTTWTLLNMAERRKQAANKCALIYADGDMAMPENQNGRSDLLDEAKRGIDFILKMQITDTASVATTVGTQPATGPLNITQINAVGMAHHKVHGESWAPDLLRPEDDNISRHLYPPSTIATLHVAAIGAQCARQFKSIDPVYSAQCLTAAETAYAAAVATPDAFAQGNFEGGGGVSDWWASDDFAWAATELFLTTQNAVYLADINTYQGDDYNTNGEEDMFWGDMQNFGMLALVRGTLSRKDTNYNAAEIKARRDIIILADNYQFQTNTAGYAIPHNLADFYWGSNATMLYRAMVLAHAYEISGDEIYYQGVVNVMDYLLGRNPLNQSYIAGYGERAMERPHHRFWANVRDSSYPKPPAGALVGGPNNTAMADPIAQALEGSCTGLTCWQDHEDAYSFNEVSIVWNAALVWVTNWLDTQSAHCSYEPLDPAYGPY